MATILVIDDDPWILDFFVEILTREGHKVHKAENGDIGLSLYRELLPDLLITDMIMPQRDGLATIMELNREYPEAKIIAVSGGGAIEPERYLRLAKTIGAKQSLKKPFTRDDLIAAVNKVLAS